jgi:hypothetical protein
MKARAFDKSGHPAAVRRLGVCEEQKNKRKSGKLPESRRHAAPPTERHEGTLLLVLRIQKILGMFYLRLDFFYQSIRDEIVGPDELNSLPTTVDDDSLTSFSTVSSFAL